MANDNRSRGGFQDMSEEKRKKLASEGGKASTGSFGEENSADPSEAGRKGGQKSRRGGSNSSR